MILPTKYFDERNALIGKSAIILKQLSSRLTISELWEHLRPKPEFASFEQFVLALDLLYLMGVVEIEGNQVRRIGQ